MTPLLFGLVALAGGAGAVVRYALDSAVSARWPGGPWGLWIVNLTGSLALGLLSGWAAAGGLSQAAAVVLGTGLLGGYTTFSSAMVDGARRLLDARSAAGSPSSSRDVGLAVLHTVGMLVGAMLAAGAGLALASVPMG